MATRASRVGGLSADTLAQLGVSSALPPEVMGVRRRRACRSWIKSGDTSLRFCSTAKALGIDYGGDRWPQCWTRRCRSWAILPFCKTRR